MILAHWHNLLRQTQIPVVSTEITFVKSQTGTSSSGSITITGLQSGDFVLCHASEDAGSEPPTPSSATNIYSCDGEAHNSSMWYEFATGTSMTQNLGSNETYNVGYLVFRGVNSSTPLDVSITAPSTDDTQNVTSITPPSITTVTNGCMIVIVMSIEDENHAGQIDYDSSYTLGVDFYNLVGDTTTEMAYKVQSSSGTETPSAFDWSAIGGTSANSAHTTTIALRPA